MLGLKFVLALIEQKINALDQAAPLAGWQLPEEFVKESKSACHHIHFVTASRRIFSRKVSIFV